MVKVYIAPATFAETSRAPLDLIESKLIQIERNELGRKPARGEIINRLRNCDGVIAGTENLIKGLSSSERLNFAP